MFRIDRKHVNLAATRSVHVDGDEETAGAEGNAPDASAAAACAAAAAAAAAADSAARETVQRAEEQAAKMLGEARAEVAELMVAAREEADETRRRAWQDGYTEGSNEGKRVSEQKYKDMYTKKINEDDEMLKRVVAELHNERDRTYEGLEDETVGLAFAIVKKLLGPAEEAAGEMYESLIRNALKQIAPEKKVIIRVGPAEYDRFFSSGTATFELDKGVAVTAAVLRDASLGDGDCIIDTEDETVNAGIDTQLEYIKIAFSRAEVGDS